ncbi:MAG TPA: hypothetical protein VGD24_03345, partial [Gallionella sp.]
LSRVVPTVFNMNRERNGAQANGINHNRSFLLGALSLARYVSRNCSTLVRFFAPMRNVNRPETRMGRGPHKSAAFNS